MPTDEQIGKMLDAWYQLTGRRIAPTELERSRDFGAMSRHVADFERSLTSPPPASHPAPTVPEADHQGSLR